MMEADLVEQVSGSCDGTSTHSLPTFISTNGHSNRCTHIATKPEDADNLLSTKLGAASLSNGYHEKETRTKQLPSPKDPPKDPSLHATEQEIETLFTEDYWRKICPQLHVNDEAMRKLVESAGVFELDTKNLDQMRKEIIEEGFFVVDKKDLPWAVNVEDLALGVVQVMQHGWPPAFIMAYDEAWILAHQVSAIVKYTTGNEMIMDWFAWYVDPTTGGRGWGPHRDRAEPNSFKEDGTPKYSTVWIPLTEASTHNSCLYVVPAPFDPHYRNAEKVGNEMMNIVFSPDAAVYQDIRACPLSAGSILSFSHHLIHWGSRGRRMKSDPPLPPRISISFASASDDFEPPYFPRSHLPLPPLPMRVALMASQAIVYGRQEALHRHTADLYKRIFMAQSQHFGSAYVDKIGFVSQWLKFARKVVDT